MPSCVLRTQIRISMFRNQRSKSSPTQRACNRNWCIIVLGAHLHVSMKTTRWQKFGALSTWRCVSRKTRRGNWHDRRGRLKFEEGDLTTPPFQNPDSDFHLDRKNFISITSLVWTRDCCTFTLTFVMVTNSFIIWTLLEVFILLGFIFIFLEPQDIKFN